MLPSSRRTRRRRQLPAHALSVRVHGGQLCAVSWGSGSRLEYVRRHLPRKKTRGGRISLNVDQTIYQRFQEVVARDPHAIAIRHGGRNYSYGELDRRAQRIAASLGVPSDAEQPVVAVLLGSNAVAEIAAIVGVIAAGAVALPLDADEPVRLLCRIIDKSRPSTMLADR